MVLLSFISKTKIHIESNYFVLKISEKFKLCVRDVRNTVVKNVECLEQELIYREYFLSFLFLYFNKKKVKYIPN